MCEKKLLNLFALFLFSFFFNSLTLAGQMGGPYHQDQNSWLSSYMLSVAAGAAFENAGQTQSLILTPTIEKTYTANQSFSALPEGELFLGLHFSSPNVLQAQLGLSLVAAGDAKLSGYIWDDMLPEFNNYTYSYKVLHAHVAGKARVLFDMHYAVKDYPLLPWVSGSLGLGWNKASQFTNTPLIFEAVVNPNFASHTKAGFTYTAGAGIEAVLNHNWQAGMGYEFSDWGKGQLGAAAGQTIGAGLSFSHLYTNAVLVNLTYLR